MGDRVLEIETKYDVDESAVLPRLDRLSRVSFVGAPQEQHLVATYFDTERLDLLRAGLTLRRRTGGQDAGWHLKLPAGQDRLELHHPLGERHEEVPHELSDVLVGLVRGQPLVEVARIETDRTVTVLRDADRRALAEVCDDHVAATLLRTGREERQSWREWELELREQDSILAREGASALIASGARPAGSTSKLARVLRDSGPPRTTPEEGVPADAPARVVIRAHLARHLATLRRFDPLARADVPDAVHRMRVECRRLRGALASFRPFFDTAVTDPLRPELKWLIDELGRPRDLEVLKERVDTLLAEEQAHDTAAGRHVSSALAEEHHDAHRRAVTAMGDARYFALVDALQVIVDEPPWSARAHRATHDDLRKVVRKEWRRVVRAAAAADRAAPEELADRLHDVRKAAKRARYAAEAVEPVAGVPAARFAAAMADVQDALGEHHDTVVTRQKMDDLTQSLAAGDAGPVGLERVHDRLSDAGSRARETYDHARRQATRPGRLHWLG